MGVGLVTINAVDATSKVDKDTFFVEYQGNRTNSTCEFELRDNYLVAGGAQFAVREQMDVIVTDGGTRIFGGRIAIATPRLYGKEVRWTIKCIGYDTLLDQRVIDSGLRDASLARYDDQDVAWIASWHTSLLTSTFVSRLRTQTLPTIDYSGMTLRKALSTLAQYTTGADYWVDMNLQVHWTDPLSVQRVVTPGWDSGSATGWSLDAAGVVTANAGPGGTGDYALITTGSGAGSAESSQTITGIIGSRRYILLVDLWSSVASKAQVRLDWQNSSSVSQRIDTLTNSGATSTWYRYKAIYTAPATATKVIVYIGGVSAFTGTVRHDNLALVGEDAAFGINFESPNGTTTFSPEAWSEKRSATNPINRVYVRGQGISGWREHAASISYYGGSKFEGVIEDDRVTTTDGIDSRAANIFRKYAFPSHSGTYVTRRSGLVAGTWQIIEIAALGVSAIEYLSTLRTRFSGASQMEYEVTYGEVEEDSAGAMVAAQTAYTSVEVVPGVGDPGLQDGIAPAVPTGLGLTTGYDTTVDGTLYPALLASWAGVADADLDAYEGEVDEANQGLVAFAVSVSGTGGTLSAGDYNVTITALSSVSGETRVVGDTNATITAGQRLYVNITAFSGASSYKVYASRSGATPPMTSGQTTSTTGSNVEVTSEGSGATPPTASSFVTFTNPRPFRTNTTSASIAPVKGGLYYSARVRAIDKAGNRSAFTSPVGTTAAPDSSAPAVPAGLGVVAGFRLVGVRWTPNVEPDLAAYELRWAPAIGNCPDTLQWSVVRQAGTNAIIDALTPGLTYYFQVRAIDTSDNVATSATDATAVDASVNPNAGWSNSTTAVAGGLSTTLAAAAAAAATNLKVNSVANVAVDDYILVLGDSATTADEVVQVTTVGTAGAGGTGLTITPALGYAKANGASVAEVTRDYKTAVPVTVGVADFAANSIIARIISAGSITADDIQAGTIKVGGASNTADYLIVYNASSVEIGRWDANGLVIKDQANTNRQMRFVNGSLAFSNDNGSTWQTAINADGIDASKITFGSQSGGSNRAPNASLELSAFSATLTKAWTTTGDWTATIATDVNVDKSTGDLKLTTATY